jgi:mannose-6-phosphate isomerase-like protein (cupin superfamily)
MKKEAETMQALDKVSLDEKFALIEDTWRPGIVGRVGDMHVKLVKLTGEFLWHSHDLEDEMFFVAQGELTMHFRDRAVIVGAQEFIIVPHDVEHKPEAAPGTRIMLIEPASTVNTGDAGGERTTEPEWL